MNCVSQTTLPHFLRFLFYAVLAMSVLAYHLLQRAWIIYDSRDLPADLGPPAWAIGHLLVLLMVNTATLFLLTILLVRTTISLVMNTTMIESWEIERHAVLVQRAQAHGGFLYAPGGREIRIEHQEFPYDIGFWNNVCHGLGSSNPLHWFSPFSSSPVVDGSRPYETNGFEDPDTTWPPPDPDKMHRVPISGAQIFHEDKLPRSVQVEAFHRRQAEDYKRFQTPTSVEDESDAYDSDTEQGMDGEMGWTNSEGDRLRDYGVDEDADCFADEDEDIPLGELRRRIARSRTIGENRIDE